MVQRENLYPANKSEAISPTKAYDVSPWSCLIKLANLVQALVQPRMMEQVVACKDDIAQQYLMQCVIQCFPDGSTWHAETLCWEPATAATGRKSTCHPFLPPRPACQVTKTSYVLDKKPKKFKDRNRRIVPVH